MTGTFPWVILFSQVSQSSMFTLDFYSYFRKMSVKKLEGLTLTDFRIYSKEVILKCSVDEIANMEMMNN